MGSVLSAAISAMDVALWDILARSVDLPIYQLLGGKVRDKAKVFANVRGDTLKARAESARRQVALGFQSLRTTPFFSNWAEQNASQRVKTAVEIVATVREAIGDEIDLGLEIHRNLPPEEAIVLGNELLPYRILYYEDPLAPESFEAVKYVAQHVNIPLAFGERNYSLYQFRELIDTGAVSWIRPDLSLVGGYTQARKIAGMAEASFVSVFPHLMGSPVNIAAFVQFDAATPNAVLHENYGVADTPLNEILEQPLTLENGYILVPDGPGIGVEVREDKFDQFPFEPRTIQGCFRADGSMANTG
jgi:galactonate dehydratase